MLSPLCRLVKQAIKRRHTLGLSQRDVARSAGCHPSYIGQVEAGIRPLSRRLAERLERIYQLPKGKFTEGVMFRRGGANLAEETRATLRALKHAVPVGSPRPPVTHQRPYHSRPERSSPLENPFWPIAIHLGAEAQQEVLQLERLRASDERFWRHANALHYDCWSEKRLTVRLGLAAPLTGVSLQSLGCEVPVAHGRTGRDTSRTPYPAFVWQHGDKALAWFPQRCVRTAPGHRWPDGLLVAARKGRKLAAVVEVDGPTYHQDAAAERRRDQELGLPVLHLAASEVQRPDVLEKVLGWVDELFAEAC